MKTGWVDGNCGLPFLNISVTLAAFKASGNIPCCKEELIKYVNGLLKESTWFLNPLWQDYTNQEFYLN